MKFIVQNLQFILLNPILWVFAYYIYKLKNNISFDDSLKRDLSLGLWLSVASLVGSELFRDKFLSALAGNGDFSKEMYQNLTMAYYFMWGLLSAVGLYKIFSVIRRVNNREKVD